MAMVVKNNMSALSALNTLNTNTTALSKSLKKVSSGMKINSAADDASGYAISEKMRVNIRSLNQANANAQNGSSMMKVAEGAVSSTVEILKTLKEKAINAANDTNTDADRQTIQKELDQSIDQIDDNANVTFNGKYLVDGSKNSKGAATYTALTNQSLSQDTTADTKLVDLASRSGDSLELAVNDQVTVSYVQAGKTYSASFKITEDSTLQDIFNAAEDIDKDSKIFATSNNEAVKAAGGVTSASSVSAEEKAIDYLKSQLANGAAGPGTFTAAGGNNSYTATDKYAGANAGNIGNGATTPADITTDSYKDPNGDVYDAGSLYTGLVNADKAVAKAETALGTKTTGGSAKVLNDALTKAGISDWDGTAASLETSAMAEKLKTALADPTNDKLQASLDAYREDVADLDTAKTDFDTAYTAYTDAQKQLDALEKQKAIDDKQAEVNALADSLKTVMGISIDNAAANGKYSAIDSIATPAGTVTMSGTTTALNSDANKTAAKEQFAKDIAAAISANAAANANATVKDELDKVVGAYFKDATNKITADTTSLSEAVTALRTLKKDKAPDSADLKAAQEQVVSKFTGPAILSGNTVGVNAAGNVIETASGEKGITITANQAGIGGQISGFNISVSDSEGKVKKSANASLDAFSETVRAQNKSEDNAVSLQVGANANQSIKIGLTDMRSEALGLKGADGTTLNISTQTKANAAINVLDNALAKALDQQTTIGSVESRLEYTQSNLTTASENVTAAESVIRDADMAKEMTEYTKNNVLMQAAQSMLSQANQSASNALSLLQ